MKKPVKWKTITVTFQLHPEFLKQLRWIARRDGVPFRSLVLEGLRKVAEAEDELHEMLEEFRQQIEAKSKPPEPQGPDTVQ